jgi:hypothetical protein
MGSKISLIRCETLGRLDAAALPACNGSASLRRIGTPSDGVHAVSGPKGRRFKSSRPDDLNPVLVLLTRWWVVP